MKNNIDVLFIENNVKGSLAIEGIEPSISGQKITRMFLQKKINSVQAIERIKRLHGVRTWKTFL